MQRRNERRNKRIAFDSMFNEHLCICSQHKWLGTTLQTCQPFSEIAFCNSLRNSRMHILRISPLARLHSYPWLRLKVPQYWQADAIKSNSAVDFLCGGKDIDMPPRLKQREESYMRIRDDQVARNLVTGRSTCYTMDYTWLYLVCEIWLRRWRYAWSNSLTVHVSRLLGQLNILHTVQCHSLVTARCQFKQVKDTN